MIVLFFDVSPGNCVAALKQGNDNPIHAASIIPLNKRSERVESIEWIWFESERTPANLVAKRSSHVIVSSLGIKSDVPTAESATCHL